MGGPVWFPHRVPTQSGETQGDMCALLGGCQVGRGGRVGVAHHWRVVSIEMHGPTLTPGKSAPLCLEGLLRLRPPAVVGCSSPRGVGQSANLPACIKFPSGMQGGCCASVAAASHGGIDGVEPIHHKL